MATRKLDKAQWRQFLDEATRALVGRQAEIEVASLALGSQVAAQWLEVIGLSYDERSDLLEIALENINHRIARPRELHVDVGPPGLAAIEVIDADGAKQIVRFRDPVMLPAPAGETAADERR